MKSAFGVEHASSAQPAHAVSKGLTKLALKTSKGKKAFERGMDYGAVGAKGKSTGGPVQRYAFKQGKKTGKI